MNSQSLRRTLHQHPELSLEEHNTAARIIEFMQRLNPDTMQRNLGGTGVAITFGNCSQSSGKHVMLRCELDALPIVELNTFAHKSQCHGVSHKCGHDGHMAILAAVAEHYSKQPPQNGQITLLFQPAEETGDGAKAVIDDPQYQFSPDYVFALHNVPKFEMGEIIVKSGTMCCASRGATIRFEGKTAHAAQPETGISPVNAINTLIPGLADLPQLIDSTSPFTFATIVGVNIGEKAFGTAPSLGEVYVTLRSETDAEMSQLIDVIETQAEVLAEQYQLSLSVSYEDVFDATVNHPQAVDVIKAALADEPVTLTDTPFRWSEDFGRFTQRHCGALFGLGAGKTTPDLHNADYDFPDELIATGSGYFIKLIDYALQA
ncbi:MAG: amidohydrolase [Psychrobium sp.]